MHDAAWQPMRADAGEPWEWVRDRFAFRPSAFPEWWPGFAEPVPSVTWDLAVGVRRPVSRDDPAYTPFLVASSVDPDGVNRLGWTALRDCVAPDAWVYALDWEHRSYRFWPHHAGPLDGWPITVYPDGDYYLFLDPELRFGTLGHPWEHTLCVFGRPLLDAVHRHNHGVLADVLRHADDQAVPLG